MPNEKTVCVDLDGVLATYDGWKGLDHIGEPRPGAGYLMGALRLRYRVVVFTTRCKLEGMERPEGETVETLRQRVTDWLVKHKIPFDEVYAGQGKPIAFAYVDDRAVKVPSNPTTNDFITAVDAVDELAH